MAALQAREGWAISGLRATTASRGTLSAVALSAVPGAYLKKRSAISRFIGFFRWAIKMLLLIWRRSSLSLS